MDCQISNLNRYEDRVLAGCWDWIGRAAPIIQGEFNDENLRQTGGDATWPQRLQEDFGYTCQTDYGEEWLFFPRNFTYDFATTV